MHRSLQRSLRTALFCLKPKGHELVSTVPRLTARTGLFRTMAQLQKVGGEHSPDTCSAHLGLSRSPPRKRRVQAVVKSLPGEPNLTITLVVGGRQRNLDRHASAATVAAAAFPPAGSTALLRWRTRPQVHRAETKQNPWAPAAGPRMRP